MVLARIVLACMQRFDKLKWPGEVDYKDILLHAMTVEAVCRVSTLPSFRAIFTLYINLHLVLFFFVFKSPIRFSTSVLRSLSIPMQSIL